MAFNRHFIIYFFVVMNLFTSLDAEVSEYDKKRIKLDLKKKRYDRLGIFLRQGVGHSSSDLSKVEKIAKNSGSQKLRDAIHATKKFKHTGGNKLLSTGSFLQTALFIETGLKKHVAHKQYYLRKNKTGLSRTVEYDPSKKRAFIVLDGIKSAYLGKGAKKTAYKAIRYNKTKPEIVARAEQSADIGRELSIAKRLRGARGVLGTDGVGRHRAHGKKYTTIYSKLYSSGNLKKAIVEKVKFSPNEKIRIGLKILQGLASMHKSGVVHRDLAAQNIFLNIPKGKVGKRKIDAVIADIRWSHYVEQLN